MRFALNYSPAAGRLFDVGLISLDLFKCPDFPEMIAAASVHAPVYVHFGLDAGTDTPPDLGPAAVLRDDTRTPYVNLHLSVRRRHWPDLSGHGGDDLGPVIDRLVSHVEPACRRFGPDRVIVENLIYHGPAHDDFLLPGVEPEVIAEVVRRTGCGLLLDLSHARIACHYAGWDPDAYLARLPLGRLRELHITGLAPHDPGDGSGPLLTDHLPLTETDFAFAQQALARIRAGDWATPDIVALEYGGSGAPFAWRTDPGVIAGQVPMLYEMVHAAE